MRTKPPGGIYSRPGHRAPEGYDGSKYEKPSVACDVVIIRFQAGRLEVLLIERGHDPYEGYWAFPGGYVDMDEDIPDAAAREVFEETGITGLTLTELGAFGDPKRDPRGRVISIAFLALVRARGRRPKAGDDARNTGWHPFLDPPELAFDHHRVIARARERLAEIAVMTPRAFDLLPQKFTATEFHELVGQIFGWSPDPRDFRDWMEIISSLRELPDTGRDREPRYRLVKSSFNPLDYFWLWRYGPARRRK